MDQFQSLSERNVPSPTEAAPNVAPPFLLTVGAVVFSALEKARRFDELTEHMHAFSREASRAKWHELIIEATDVGVNSFGRFGNRPNKSNTKGLGTALKIGSRCRSGRADWAY